MFVFFSFQATGFRSIAFHPDGRTLFCGADDGLKVLASVVKSVRFYTIKKQKSEFLLSLL